jgi:outer membrane lipoprotein-sorting protein
MKRMKLLVPMCVLLVLSVAAVGCSVGQQVTASDVIQKTRDTMKSLQTVQGKADISLTINKDGLKLLAQGMMPSDMQGKMGNQDWTSKLPDSVAITLNTWRQASDKARIEVESASIPGAKGAILVYDGTKVYAYDAANNTVYTGTPDKLMQNMPAEMQGILQGADPQQTMDKIIAASDIKLVGSEKVGGLDAYKLDITPKPNAAETLGLPQAFQTQAGVIIKDLHATLWVDSNRWIPLKFTLEHPNMGSLTYTASNVVLNQPIDAAQFVLQVPPGAKTVDLDALQQKMQPKSLTLLEARVAAKKDGWKLLEATYPTNATVVGVTDFGGSMMSERGLNGFQLHYSSAASDFTVIEANPAPAVRKFLQGTNPSAPGAAGSIFKRFFAGEGQGSPTSAQDVTVRGVTASAVTFGDSGRTVLAWQEKDGGIWVVVTGKFSTDEAVKIAEGLK